MNRNKKTCQDSECENSFWQYNSLQKYCSPSCAYKNAKKPEQKKRKRIPYMSKKRKVETGLYTAKRIHFLAQEKNKWCPVFPHLKTTEVHHMKGRIGDLYLDTNFWLAVSEKGHKKIEMNPDWATEKGFSLSRLATSL